MEGQGAIKIHYFDEDGRAEVSRLVCVWAEKSFEDIRIPFEKWPVTKPAMPLGQVPVLEVDGQKYPQSLAIASYLAREFGLYGRSNLDSLKIDIVAQTVLEFRVKASKHYYEQDAKIKSELATELTAKEAPTYLAYLESQLVKNQSNVMVGDQVTLADLIIYDLFQGALGKFTQPNIAHFPHLQKLVEKISDTEVIKKYAIA
ncbi:glutathione s-transferase [Plakobranchus ocellatus]|uniref:Glutathione s-transferase n=1 Tax=Plakobranchus ocellatus TaxID=259542 RepID=A0AAV3Y028_9GAST|nr:glutathione s-transferase [Plakobranchus ocellatus]